MQTLAMLRRIFSTVLLVPVLLVLAAVPAASQSRVIAGTSGQIVDIPTVQAAAYVSGNCIGGFRSVAVVTGAANNGFVTNFRVTNLNGATSSITVYLFDSQPSASTCTDRSTFTLNSADSDKLIAPPQSVTLAAATGTTISFGSVDFTPPRPFSGAVSTNTATIWYALVSGSSFTPATTADFHQRIGIVRN